VAKVLPDYLNSEYVIREIDKAARLMAADPAYKKFAYGLSGKEFTPKWSWEQQAGIWAKKGVVGSGKGLFKDAFRRVQWVNLSHDEAKYHMLKSLFNQKGGSLRRFKSVYNELNNSIEGFSTDILFYDNIIHNTEAWKTHIAEAAEYVHQHAGGIVGDHIKEQFFTAGKQSWAPNALGTIDNKIEQKKKIDRSGTMRYPYVHTPLWGMTGKNTGLPDGWHQYTYKYANWPQSSHLIRTVSFPGTEIFKARWGMQRTAGFVAVRGFRKGGRRMAQGRFLRYSDYGGGNNWGVEYPNKSDLYSRTGTGVGRMYAPGNRTALMDLVAYLNPKAGYKNSPHNGGRGHVFIGNIIEPFSQFPQVFLHERGYTTNRGARVPARPFLTPGVRNGVNDASRLFREYIKHGHKGIRDGISITGKAMYSAAATDSLYSAIMYYDIHKRYGGIRGVQRDGYTVYSSVMDVGQINRKVQASKKQAMFQFNTRHLWWLLPPSKYYHYVGMAFDIGSVVMGGFWSMGAVQAWIQAMSVGMAGARAGTPVPFTRKAQRRKFRKGLYTRAGYHRSGSLGTGGR